MTNNIYGSNIGVLGTVGRDTHNKEFVVTGTGLDTSSILELVLRIKESSGGLPASVAEDIREPLSMLTDSATKKDSSRVQSCIATIKNILEGAGGNLAAAGILAAIGTH